MSVFNRLLRDSKGYYIITAGQCIEVLLQQGSKAKGEAEWAERPATYHKEE